MFTMSKLFIAVVLALSLSGCVTASGFLGSSDPCGQAANIHAAFLVGVTVNPRLAKFRKVERAGYSSVVEYCASGDVKKPTLQRLVAAYAAAIADYKSKE